MDQPDALSFPVGRFVPVLPVTADVRREAINDIAALPIRLRAALAGLDDGQLDTPYRPGGWTVRQLVHHVADSHMNGYIRVKLALTEDGPTIKPYDQDRFAQLPDSGLPVDVSLAIVDGLHARWAEVYRTLSAAQFERVFVHPEQSEPQTLDRHLQTYAWHSRHHVAHITGLRQRQGW